jgi:hypothetical protein
MPFVETQQNVHDQVGLWRTTMCHCRIIGCDKCTPDSILRVREAGEVGQEERSVPPTLLL